MSDTRDVISLSRSREPFKYQLRRDYEAYKQRVIADIKSWMSYWAGYGQDVFVLEDCPHLRSKKDVKIAADWLENEGFQVRRGRFLTPLTVARLPDE